MTQKPYIYRPENMREAFEVLRSMLLCARRDDRPRDMIFDASLLRDVDTGIMTYLRSIRDTLANRGFNVCVITPNEAFQRCYHEASIAAYPEIEHFIFNITLRDIETPHDLNVIH